ncbi:uncharacterized protein ASCRUDRAFT_77786 [Ascoidea rubescens DSM 1968]|uniref:Uncharacterized protein n=1 Tax=Ascoidea rubescens DSM 1968 TaxID=1344418 RepID=A0A1D2VA42_9ASCO|nr:hypothetical protein ASCRUDRAFT_77786 [Ascoidea rubescens DSM 1968]ODV58530.1 hypothetical protein ASCRUDRAFT_77786 [Ascoidea rubescens DSM 1968]
MRTSFLCVFSVLFSLLFLLLLLPLLLLLLLLLPLPLFHLGVLNGYKPSSCSTLLLHCSALLFCFIFTPTLIASSVLFQAI